MQDNDQKNKTVDKPDENGKILVDEHIKIFDPQSGKVLLDKRDSN